MYMHYKFNINSQRGKQLLKKYIRQYLIGGGKNYFKKNTTLKTKQKKFCRCVLHVAKNNDKKCNIEKKWNTNKCYNPYTVCASSVKTTTGGKTCQYNFLSRDIPDKSKLIGFKKLLELSSSFFNGNSDFINNDPNIS